MIRVLLIDEQPLTGEDPSAWLSALPDVKLAGEVWRLDQGVRRAGFLDPDTVLLRLSRPGTQGAEACATLTRRHRHLRVLVLTRSADDASMVSAFLAGARGFLIEPFDASLLGWAIRTVADGGTFVDPRVAGKLVAIAVHGIQPRGPHGLTAREMRILRLLPRGFSNREIAAELGVSVETVKTHVRSILRKLEVPDRVRAAGIAIREGLV